MSNFYYPVKTLKNKFDGYIFIMPVVAAGNVGQLSVDLLLSTLTVELVGRFHHVSITPIAGGDPYQNGPQNFTTSCQLYECQEKKLLILQQRSPILPSCRKSFVSMMNNWVKTQEFKATIVLSSCFNHFQTENDKLNKVKFLATSNILNQSKTVNLETLKNMKQIIHSDTETSEDSIHLPGGGIADLLFQEFAKTKLPILILVSFCSEGDNTPDALDLVNHLNEIKSLVNSNDGKNPWKWPVSWNCLFGNKAPDSIY